MNRLARYLPALLVLAWSRGALADPPRDLEQLLEEPVVSTASDAAEDASTAPATSSVLTADDMRRYGIRSIDEAIDFLSLGMVSGNPLRAKEVGSRGVLLTGDFGDHVLVLVNGHAMNELWYGTSYIDRGAGIPMELVDHVEIILGPGSVLYGSHAMLGVINIITKRASAYQGVHVIAESEFWGKRDGAAAGVAKLGPVDVTSARAAIGAGYEFHLFGVPAEVTAQVEYYSSSGPAFSLGPQTAQPDSVTLGPKRFNPAGPATGIWGGVASNSYFSQVPAAYVRTIVGDFEVNLRASMYRRGTPYPNNVNLSFSDFDDARSLEQDRFGSIDIRHHGTLSSKVELTSRLYADLYDYRQRKSSSAAQDCGAVTATGCFVDGLGVSKWIGLEERLAFDWFGDGRFASTVGADGRTFATIQRYEQSDRAGGPSSLTSPTEYRAATTIGLYAQQTARPVKWLGVNVGVRADADYNVQIRASPRAALSVSPWDGGTAKVIYSQAFRAPSVYELSYQEAPTQALPSLTPETIQSAEASFEQRFGAHRFHFGVFRSWWRDLIVYHYDETAGLGTYINVNDLDSYGYEAAYDGSFVGGKVRAGLSATAAYSRKKTAASDSELLPASPSFFGNARMSWELGDPLPTLAIAAQLVGSTIPDQTYEGNFLPVTTIAAHLRLHPAITGKFPGVTGLSYRLVGSFDTATRAPYVVGPNQSSDVAGPRPELAPVDSARAMLGLQYDFGG